MSEIAGQSLKEISGRNAFVRLGEVKFSETLGFRTRLFRADRVLRRDPPPHTACRANYGAASTVSLNPIALVTATSVDNRGLP